MYLIYYLTLSIYIILIKLISQISFKSNRTDVKNSSHNLNKTNNREYCLHQKNLKDDFYNGANSSAKNFKGDIYNSINSGNIKELSENNIYKNSLIKNYLNNVDLIEKKVVTTPALAVLKKNICVKIKTLNLVKFNNFFIFINNECVNNYKLSFINGKMMYIKNCENCYIKIIPQKHRYAVFIKTSKPIHLKLTYYCISKYDLKPKQIKINGSIKMVNATKVYTFYNNTKVVNHYRTVLRKRVKYGFNISFLNDLPITTQTRKSKQKLNKAINVKNFNIDVVNNKLIITNKGLNLNNLVNFNAIVDKKIIRKLQFRYGEKNNSCFINIDKSIDLFSGISGFLSLKINSKNKNINNLINNFLPNKILNLYKKFFKFQSFYEFLNQYENLNFYYKTSIQLLLKSKQYVQLYNYILNKIIGIKFINNTLLFVKPNFNLGKVIVAFNNNSFLIFSNINDFYVVYNNIIYKNIKKINFDKSNCTIKVI